VGNHPWVCRGNRPLPEPWPCGACTATQQQRQCLQQASKQATPFAQASLTCCHCHAGTGASMRPCRPLPPTCCGNQAANHPASDGSSTDASRGGTGRRRWGDWVGRGWWRLPAGHGGSGARGRRGVFDTGTGGGGKTITTLHEGNLHAPIVCIQLAELHSSFGRIHQARGHVDPAE
jgi:hypothetical protein